MALKLFSNILAYRLTQRCELNTAGSEHLAGTLETRASRLPSPMELSTAGFHPLFGVEDNFVEVVRPGTFLLQVMQAERMLPAKIVRQQVLARVKAIEDEQERKVYAKEKNQIKDSIITDMLPRAFIDQRHTMVMVSGPYIFIDTTSAKRGEDILSLLREVLGSLPVRPVAVKGTPIAKYTDLFTKPDDLPSGLWLTGDFNSISDADEIDSVKGNGTSPELDGLSDLVRDHGRRVTMLGLQWEDPQEGRVTFKVNEMLGVKGIKWPEEITDMAASDAGEDADQVTLLRATMLLLSKEITGLFAMLFDLLGGEDIPDSEQGLSDTVRGTNLRASLVQTDDEDDTENLL